MNVFMERLHEQLLPYYQLTTEQRRSIFRAYRSCSICKGKSRSNRLVIDHCHASGFVRGVLCERCNSWLGVLEGRRSAAAKEKHLRRVQTKYQISLARFRRYLKRTGFAAVSVAEVSTPGEPMTVVDIN